MAPNKETPQERCDRYLRLASEAEVTAAKVRDLRLKAAWIELAVSWMLMASEIASENERRRKRKPGGGAKS